MKHLLAMLAALLLAACAPAPTTMVAAENGVRYDSALLPESAVVEVSVAVEGHNLLLCSIREPLPKRNEDAPQRYEETMFLFLFDETGKQVLFTRQLGCDSADVLGASDQVVHLLLGRFYEGDARFPRQSVVHSYATLDIAALAYAEQNECPPPFETEDGYILLHDIPSLDFDNATFGATLFGKDGSVATVTIPLELVDLSMWDRIITYSEEPYSPTDTLAVTGGKIATLSNQKSTYTVDFKTGDISRSLAYTQEMLSEHVYAHSPGGTLLMAADTWGRGDGGFSDTVLLLPSGEIKPLLTNHTPQTALFIGDERILLNFVDKLALYDAASCTQLPFTLEHTTYGDGGKLLYPVVGIGYDAEHALYLAVVRDLTREVWPSNEDVAPGEPYRIPWAPTIVKVFDQEGGLLRSIELDGQFPHYHNNYLVPYLLESDGKGNAALIDIVLRMRNQAGLDSGDECRAIVRYLP